MQHDQRLAGEPHVDQRLLGAEAEAAGLRQLHVEAALADGLGEGVVDALRAVAGAAGAHADGDARLYVRVHRRLVFQADRDPRRLLRRQQIVRRRCLHLDHTADRVLDLVHVVRVPAGDQPGSLVEVATGLRPSAAAQLDHWLAGFVRFG